MLTKYIAETIANYRLKQGSPNYGSQAGSGPPRSPIRAAVPFPKI